MVYYIMNSNGKVITRSTVSPLKPHDYDINENKDRINNLDKTIEQRIGNYRNTVNTSSTQIPKIDDENLEEQLLFCFNLKPIEIKDSKENAASNEKMTFIDDVPTYNIETEFDKFLGIYVEL